MNEHDLERQVAISASPGTCYKAGIHAVINGFT
eukprot:SAG22_NODE_573_length_8999_cov_9.592921_5_plen_33_part_00